MKANKSQIKKESTTDCFPIDFYNRSFSILASIYKSGPEQSTILPNPKQEYNAKEENKSQFQSRIIDLRLRRNQNQRETINKESNEMFLKSYKKYEKLIKNNEDDITAAFEPEQVVRPDVPLYVQNIIKDEKEITSKYGRKKKPASMNMGEIEKKYQEKLKHSKQVGIQRAKHRFELYTAHDNKVNKQNVESV